MAVSYTTNGSVDVKINSTFTKVKSTDGKPTETINKTIANKYTYGTSTDNAEFSYYDTQTVAATGSYYLDLNALVSEIGGTIVTTKLCSLVVEHASPTLTGNITMGAASGTVFSAFLNASGSTVAITPGGTFATMNFHSPYTVDSSHKFVKFYNNDTASGAVINIHVVGQTSSF